MIQLQASIDFKTFTIYFNKQALISPDYYHNQCNYFKPLLFFPVKSFQTKYVQLL